VDPAGSNSVFVSGFVAIGVGLLVKLIGVSKSDDPLNDISFTALAIVSVFMARVLNRARAT